MSTTITITSVFMAGLASFFSPCIIPLIPMYISFLAGDLEEGGHSKKKLYINALGFFIGLMSVFILLGAVASALGSLLLDASVWLRKFFGIVIIIFGFFQLGIVKPSFLMRERKMKVAMKQAKFGTAVLMGIAFSFGWTPCVTPILGAVLFLAADSQTLSTGMMYLVVYSLGFFIPFAVSTLLMGYFIKWLEAIGKYLGIIKKITGVILIAVGYLIFTNGLTRITNFFS